MLELGSPIGDGVSSIQQKNLLEVADLSSNHCAWGSITSKRLYGGYSISASGLLLALL